MTTFTTETQARLRNVASLCGKTIDTSFCDSGTGEEIIESPLQLQHDISALLSEVERLRTALEPFAKVDVGDLGDGEWLDLHPRNRPLYVLERALNPEDFRRAREALSQGTGRDNSEQQPRPLTAEDVIFHGALDEPRKGEPKP